MYLSIHNIIEFKLLSVRRIKSLDDNTYTVNMEIIDAKGVRYDLTFFAEDLATFKGVLKLPPINEVIEI